jgi:hypothetical protein
MTAYESRPTGAASEAWRLTQIVPQTAQIRPLKISDTADAWIEQRADDLAWGRLELAELPRALRTLYFAGYANGEQSQQERINRLEYLCDLNHFLAHNRGKTGADFMRAQTAALWTAAVTA